MNVLYADTSAIVRAYLAEEPEHEKLRSRLLEGDEPVVTSEITRVEFASAVSVAVRARRLKNSTVFINRFDADCADDGPITLLRLDGEAVFPLAHRLVAEHDIRTLDAIHLAVLSTSAVDLAGGDTVVLVTRDRRQARAATEMGLQTA